MRTSCRRLPFALLVLACSSGSNGPRDAAPSDAPPEQTSDVVGDGGVRCAASAACPADHFCGSASGTCISDVVQVAAGTGHTCALHRDGRVTCWGYGGFIGPGLGTLTSPLTVALPRPATAVAVGAEAACARLDDGSARCWGILGGRLQGVSTIVGEDGAVLAGLGELAGGTLAFCALAPAGTYCWGSNESAELGRPPGSSVAPTTAVLVHPGPRKLLTATVAIVVHDGASELCGWGANDAGLVPGPRGVVARPSCVNDVRDVFSLSGGDGHVCARRGGNRFSCWGSNSGGQLGTGDDSLLDIELPGRITTLPGPIVTIAAGGYHTCALVEGPKEGAVYCFGNNDHAQVGQPSSAAVFSPVAVTGFAGKVTAIGAGAEANHTCAILEDGSLSCWGLDDRAQLGDGPLTEDSTRNSPRPVAVRF